MGIFNIFRSDASLTIADCLNRSVTKVSNFPATLNGRSPGGETTPLCRISEEKRKYYITALDPDSLPLLDGEPIDQRMEIKRDQLYPLTLKGHLLAIAVGSDEPDLGKDFRAHKWSVEASSGDRLRLQLKSSELNQRSLQERFTPTSRFIAIPGSLNIHFPLKELINLLPKEPAATPPPNPLPHTAQMRQREWVLTATPLARFAGRPFPKVMS